MSQPNVEMLATADLRPWLKNARTHSRKQIRQIADSIERFGFTNPVLIDNNNAILAGHGRVAAAELLGMSEVPCLRIETMTPEEKRAYVIADNKLALNAGWDEDMLGEELKALLDLDLDFDIGITGFSIPEIEAWLMELGPEEPGDPADDILPDRGPSPLPSRRHLAAGAAPADLRQILWIADTVAALMGGEQAQMVFTDPPYNVPDPGPCRRLRRHQASRVRHGLGRDEPGGVHRLPAVSFRKTWSISASTAQSTSSAWTGATWPRCWQRAPEPTASSRT